MIKTYQLTQRDIDKAIARRGQGKLIENCPVALCLQRTHKRKGYSFGYATGHSPSMKSEGIAVDTSQLFSITAAFDSRRYASLKPTEFQLEWRKA